MKGKDTATEIPTRQTELTRCQVISWRLQDRFVTYRDTLTHIVGAAEPHRQILWETL